ncbi:hypothetical protein EST38_g9508, partial [Candolleomyces aberdarensis]
MRPFGKLCLNSATALLLAASQLVSAADVDWEPYLEGYKNSLHNFGIFDGRRTTKPALAELRKSRPVADVNGNTIPDYDVLYEFDQLIDHNNASRGTFKMRYYHTWEYYREGGLIILYVLGEEGIDVNRMLLSHPGIPTVLTHQFSMGRYPGIFWAAYASSAAVQPKIDFWQYWSTIEQHMPANCTADVKAVVSLIDGVLDSGNQTRMTEIKTQFGLGSLGTLDFVN